MHLARIPLEKLFFLTLSFYVFMCLFNNKVVLQTKARTERKNIQQNMLALLPVCNLKSKIVY